jgi:phosphatidylglycerol:prolipoprotein diacylglycerol transferase
MMPDVLAAIPYEAFPEISLGPLDLRTFGLMVGLGVLVGALVAARYIERATGVDRDATYALATRMVIAGVIGARITWVLSHLDRIDSPVDVIAIWEGGLQFSGGFIAAVIVGFPTFRRWTKARRWRVLDGYALGLTIGLAFGRVGCYSVGEHFGGTTTFFLGTRYEGGSTREGPPEIGEVIHHTALYEMLHLLVLFGLLLWLLTRRRPAPAPGTGIGVFCLWYGVARFGTDFLRAYDETVLGLTGAQWLMLVVAPIGVWILLRVRRQTAAALAAGEGEDAVVAVVDLSGDARVGGEPGDGGDGTVGDTAEDEQQAAPPRPPI